MKKERVLAAVLAAVVLGSTGGIVGFSEAIDENPAAQEIIEVQSTEEKSEEKPESVSTEEPASSALPNEVAAEQNGEREEALTEKIEAEEISNTEMEMEINTAAENGERYIIGDYTSAENISGNDKMEVSYEHPRLTDLNSKISWEAGKGKDFFFLNVSNPDQKISVVNYSYINMWVYNDKVCKTSDGKISQLSWIIKTGNSPTDMGNYYFRYKLSVDWTGWKLVSVPLNSFNKEKPEADLKNGVYQVFFSANNWVHNTVKWEEAHSLNVERVWFSKTPPASSFGVTGTSIENGAGYVPKDLGGNHTYTITADQKFAEAGTAGHVEVEQDEQTLSDDLYSINVNGRELNIVFSEDLTVGSTYTIRLKSGIYDLDGNLLKNPEEYSFTVEAATKEFKVMKTSVANGAVEVDVALGANTGAGEKPTYTINTNNPIEEAGIHGKVRVYRNGILQHDGFELEIDSNKLLIRFDDVLQNGAEYQVRLAENLTDVFGNLLTGGNSFSFTTVQPIPDIFELAVFDSEESLKILNVRSDGSSITSDNAHLYGKSLRIDIPKSPKDRTARAAGIPVDAREYKYANYWIYSPEKTGKYLNLCLYTTDSGGNGYFMTRIPVDWSGWKLISLELKNYGVNNSAKWENVHGFTINANGWLNDKYPSWTDGGFIQVERIWLSKSKAEELAFQGTTLPQNITQMPVRDMTVGFVYRDELNSCPDGNVVLKQNGQIVDKKLAVELQGNQLNVTVTDMLESGQTYTIEVGKNLYGVQGNQAEKTAAYTFTTAESGLAAGKPELTDVSGLSAGAKVKVQNLGTEEGAAVLHLAFFGEDGQMLGHEAKKEVLSAGAEKEITVPVTEKEDAVLIKAFVTDEKNTLLYGGYASAGLEEKEETRVYQEGIEASQVNVTEIELNERLLQIQGSLRGAPNCVLIGLQAEDGTQVLSAPVIPDQDGKFRYYYDFGELKSGSYKLTVSGYRNVKPVENTVQYLSSEDRDALLKGVNAAENVGTVTQILVKNSEVLGISELTDERIDGIAEALYEKKPYGDYAELVAQLKEIQTLIDELNHTSWSGMTEFLSDNEAMIMGDSQAYKKYLKLSEKKKNMVNQIIVDFLPVDSFGDFRTVFATAMDKYEKTEQTGGGSTGGGSGGGGSFGGNSGNSTAIGVDREDYQPDPVAPWEENSKDGEIFNDLSSVNWARESIMSLYEKGVVSPAADGRFRPDDSVTREEFVKLLTAGLGLKSEKTGCSFTDAEDGAWYIPYLAAAEEIGIILGNPDGSFGVGQEITREDMAVMAARAVEKMGKQFPEQVEQQSFVDNSEISDYAVEAVYAMQRAGILSGMDDGSFMPGSATSRAQAAKVIFSLMAVFN